MGLLGFDCEFPLTPGSGKGEVPSLPSECSFSCSQTCQSFLEVTLEFFDEDERTLTCRQKLHGEAWLLLPSKEANLCSRMNQCLLSEHLERGGQWNGMGLQTPVKAALVVACFLLGAPLIGISEQTII